jgi:hypothetical protein
MCCIKEVRRRLGLDQFTIATLGLFRPIQILVVLLANRLHICNRFHLQRYTLPSSSTSALLHPTPNPIPIFPPLSISIPTPHAPTYTIQSVLIPLTPSPPRIPTTSPRLFLIVRLVLMHPHPSPLHSSSYLVPSAPHLFYMHLNEGVGKKDSRTRRHTPNPRPRLPSLSRSRWTKGLVGCRRASGSERGWERRRWRSRSTVGT